MSTTLSTGGLLACLRSSPVSCSQVATANADLASVTACTPPEMSRCCLLIADANHHLVVLVVLTLAVTAALLLAPCPCHWDCSCACCWLCSFSCLLLGFALSVLPQVTPTSCPSRRPRTELHLPRAAFTPLLRALRCEWVLFLTEQKRLFVTASLPVHVVCVMRCSTRAWFTPSTYCAWMGTPPLCKRNSASPQRVLCGSLRVVHLYHACVCEHWALS